MSRTPHIEARCRAALCCLLLLLGACRAHTQPLPQVQSGRVLRLAHFPSRHVQPRHVDVWLPPGYDGKKPHAVLYLHDGQMLFDSTATWNKQEWRADETMAGLLASRSIRPTIVVGIWSVPELRRREYAPQKALDYLDAGGMQMLREAKDPGSQQPVLGSGGLLSDHYLKFLTTELKPFIDSAFCTRPERRSTFIGGSSMGGLISLYAICEYPQVFGGAACLSTHWVGPIFRAEDNPYPAALLAYMDAHLPSHKTHRLYFDHGTATLDALYPAFQQRADTLMRAKRYSRKNWQTRVFEHAEHSERAWAARLHLPLRFLLQ
ncbi:MAG TPA: alpha/beta hydrolase-fold protein [Saprospiraceae bacterium]|nr:alpha/beta hydrolase-fold protein [Saprospiraceae bacterium]